MDAERDPARQWWTWGAGALQSDAYGDPLIPMGAGPCVFSALNGFHPRFATGSPSGSRSKKRN
jgi:hypothetical protein